MQYASLFAIGIMAGRGRWLGRMPASRGYFWLGVGAALVIACYFVVGTGMVRAFDSRSWLVCAWESALSTGLCVGLPVAFRELANRSGPLLRMLAANSYAAYVFHFPFVMLLQWALIGAPLPAWTRIALTLIGAIVFTFTFTNFVVLRLPGARRVF